MRIKAIRLTWFRGAADPVALETNGKSLVVYGQNGSGKSSFVDAVEYIVNNGRLEHLAHKYSGSNQRFAIPNIQTPAGRKTEIEVRFTDGSDLKVTIAVSGTHSRAGGEAANMGAWEYRRTILRQDEVAAFIRSDKGEKYSALLPLLGLQPLETSAENLNKLARAVEQQSTRGQKVGALAAARRQQKLAFGDDSTTTLHAKIAALHGGYCPTSVVTEGSGRLAELDRVLSERVDRLSGDLSRYNALRDLANVDLGGMMMSIRDAAGRLASSVEPLVAEKLTVLRSAASFAAKFGTTAEIVCPACGRSMLAEHFRAHVSAEYQRLEGLEAIFNERSASIGNLIDGLKLVKKTLARGEVASWLQQLKHGSLKAQAEAIEHFNPENLRHALAEEDLQAIDQTFLPIIAAATEESRNAPRDIRALSDDRNLIEAARAAFQSKLLADEVARIETLIAFINSVEAGLRDEIRERAEAVIGELTEDIGTMWKILHPAEPIQDVRLSVPNDDKSIDIALTFYGKSQDSPRLTLSEGYRNSLGLCIFLAMAKRDEELDRPLILDDVVVSLDRNHRGMVVQLLQEHFANRQVIIFTHDRDWYADLRGQLDGSAWQFKALLPYENPKMGIRWAAKTTTFGDARAQVKDRPDSACNDARKIMDIDMALAAEMLQIRLPYLRGDKNDHRMCLEFLARLRADGRKCFQQKAGPEYVSNVTALDALEKASHLLVTWGNRGSHGFDIEPPEATTLIDACESARSVFDCILCGKPVWHADTGNAGWVECHCGNLRWRYDKG